MRIVLNTLIQLGFADSTSADIVDRAEPVLASGRAVSTDELAQVARAGREYNYARCEKPLRTIAAMTMETPDALQHHVHRREISHHQSGIESGPKVSPPRAAAER